MARTLRNLVLGLALVWCAFAPAQAQQIRDRELKPDFDLTKMQMPVEIVAVKLNGEEVRPGTKIQGDDDWLKGLSFTLKNISDKPIAHIEVGLKFPQPNGFVVYILPYGPDISRGDYRAEYAPPAIQPGGSVNLVLTKENYKSFLYVLEQGEASRSFDVAPYYIEKVCFEGEPDVIWAYGMLKQRIPGSPTEFKPIGRYVLPARQQ